jgi:hypothetical protein
MGHPAVGSRFSERFGCFHGLTRQTEEEAALDAAIRLLDEPRLERGLG